ncbi:hypothetical protein, partial [Phaeobacter sp. S60]|uniref:hypothetical protein n=1 Tax=Phaeobacter sp. S60 TaxID=1569353 RepID=UPI001A7E4A0A
MNGYAPSSGIFEFFTFVAEPKSKQKRVRSLLHVETEPMAALIGRWPSTQLAASFKMGSLLPCGGAAPRDRPKLVPGQPRSGQVSPKRT